MWQYAYLTHSPASIVWPSLVLVILGIRAGDGFLGLGAVLAWASHVLLDSLNPSGVPVRVGTYRCLARVPYDSVPANGLLILTCGFWIIVFLASKNSLKKSRDEKRRWECETWG